MHEKILCKNFISLIQNFEGFCPYLYTCLGGFKTIGYGHRVNCNEKTVQFLTAQQAELILKNDLNRILRCVVRLIKVPLKIHQLQALISFTFNIGAGALQRSQVRSKVNRQEHENVPKELLKWIWAGNQKSNGLLRRRKMEGDLYRGDLRFKFNTIENNKTDFGITNDLS